MGILYIRSFLVLISYGISQPEFVPPDFIHAVVVAATGGISGFVEFGMQQHGSGGFLTSGGTAVDTYAIHIHILILLSGSFNPGDVIGKSCIFQILVAYVLEFT